jgi:hypothetical protein
MMAVAAGLGLARRQEHGGNGDGGGKKKRFGFHGILTTQAAAVYSVIFRIIL